MSRILLMLALALCAVRSYAHEQDVVPIEPARAETHVRLRVQPEYPPLAVAAKVEGTVTLAVIVSPTGMVEAAQAVRSIPILDQAAIDAVKQWQFTPFEADGRPVRAVTEVSIPFYLDPNTARLAGNMRDTARGCRALLDGKSYEEAEAACAATANMAARLPASDRAYAYHLAGRMFAARGLLPKAIEAFKAELKLRGGLGGGGARAAAHQGLAAVYAAGNDLKNARRQYDEAEKTARDFVKSVNRTIEYVRADPPIADYMRGNAIALLRSILTDYVECLRKAALDADAANVQRKLDDVLSKG